MAQIEIGLNRTRPPLNNVGRIDLASLTESTRLKSNSNASQTLSGTTGAVVACDIQCKFGELNRNLFGAETTGVADTATLTWCTTSDGARHAWATRLVSTFAHEERRISQMANHPELCSHCVPPHSLHLDPSVRAPSNHDNLMGPTGSDPP